MAKDNVLPFPGNIREPSERAPGERMSGIQLRGSHGSLVSHLQSIADHADVQMIIQLLQDIRRHQDHPRMQQAFTEHKHQIAADVKDHSQDIFELLVADYLRSFAEAGQSFEADDIDDAHKTALEAHVKHTLTLTLQGYMEAVEEIRGEIDSVADHFRTSQAVSGVRELVESLQQNRANPQISGVIQGLTPEQDAHHVFHGDSADIEHALATVAVRKGFNTPLDATTYVNSVLQADLENHFREGRAALQQGSQSTETSVIDLRTDTIQQTCLQNARLQAVFSLLQGLREELGPSAMQAIDDATITRILAFIKKTLGENDSPLPQLSQIIDSPIEADIKALFVEQTVAEPLDLPALENKLKPLAKYYLQVVRTKDPNVSAVINNIERARRLLALQQPSQQQELIGQHIPRQCTYLRAFLEKPVGTSDTTDILIELWLRKDFGNLFQLKHLLADIIQEAQEHHLDPAVFQEHPANRQGNHPVSVSPKRSELHRPTVPGVAPPSSGTPSPKFYIPPDALRARRLPKIEGNEVQVPAVSTAEFVPLNPESLQHRQEASIGEGETYQVPEGSLTRVVYARPHSVIEVEDGGMLDLSMVDDGVKIVLKGPRSCVRLDRHTKPEFCHSISIVDAQGQDASKSPNVEAGSHMMDIPPFMVA